MFSDSIASRIKMYNFNKTLKNGKAEHLLLPGTTQKQLLQYLDVNLKIYTPETVLIHTGINDVLNYNWFGFTTRVSLEVLEKKYMEKTFCSSYDLMYIDDRNIRELHLCQNNLHFLQSGKKVLCNNFFSYLNGNFLLHAHPSQTWT